MNTVFQINTFSTLRALGAASELTHLRIADHSARVSYIAMRISEEIQLSQKTRYTLLQATLLHDIGVSSSHEKLRVVDLNTNPTVVNPHCVNGAELLGQTKLFSHLTEIVLRHHDPWRGPSIVNQEGTPNLLSQIICLADRLETLIDKASYILWQKQTILEYFEKHRGTTFNPELIDILHEVAAKDSFWLDLQTGFFHHYLEDIYPIGNQKFHLDQLEDIAKLFSKIIDRKSVFTNHHSQGVANYAVKIGEKVGFSESEQKQLKIAGLLHDLGKLALPDELLDHPGRYSEQQMLLMKQHTYHTYHLINFMGPGFRNIRDWAAFHHERLDGQGYPFGLNGSQLDLGSRIVAVADITQALTEERPYRKGLPYDQVKKILRQFVEEQALDGNLVDIALELIQR